MNYELSLEAQELAAKLGGVSEQQLIQIKLALEYAWKAGNSDYEMK